MNSHPRTLYESIFSNTESLHKYIWCVYCSVWSPAKIIASYSEQFKVFAYPMKVGALCLVWVLTNISTFLKNFFKKFVLSEGHFNWRPIQLFSHATVTYWGAQKIFLINSLMYLWSMYSPILQWFLYFFISAQL